MFIRNTPDSHITTFACQLDRRQVEYKDHGVTVTKANKVDHFVAQVYACDLFKAKILDEYYERNDKSWGGTHPHFMKQYAKEHQKLARNKSKKS